MGERRLADRTEFHWRQVKRNGKEVSVCRSVAFFAALALGHYGIALAAPTGGVITRGSGQIEQVGPRTNVDQASRRLDIDWTTFSTRANESINFRQPDQFSTAINRVVGGVPSELRGALNANGRVFIINRSGITFHKSSQVNVGALLATTAGRLRENGDSLRFDGAEGAVINHGNIRVSDGGFALLVAPDVVNTGYIQADLGQVTLASGKGFTLDLRGDGLIAFKVDEQTVGTVVNAGVLRARSGTVQMTAADAQDALASVINMDGIIDADAFGNGPGGSVLLHGGAVNLSGDVHADGQRGGRVTVTGDHVALSGARVSASGPAGGGEVRVGGDFQGQGDTYRARTTSVDAGSRIRADASTDGDGGYVIVWSDGTTTVHGEITARGGARGGDGGFIETSGKKELVFSRSADASAPHGAPGTWLLDPENIDIGRGEADAIEGSLNQGNNVEVKTSSEGEGEGNIAVNASITKSEGDDAALSMEAHGRIDVNAPITSTSGKLDVNLTAASAVNVNSEIVTNGGAVRSRVTGVVPAEVEEPAGEVVIDLAGLDDPAAGDDGAGSENLLADDHGEAAPVVETVDEDEAGAGGDAGTGAETLAEESVPAPEPDLRPSFALGGAIRTAGGDVSIEAVAGVANIDGVIDASNPAEGAVGGHVEVFADQVHLGSEAVIDVSGDAGGGTALIGGDYQGGGDKPTATRTTVARGAELRADATGSGDGGTIVVWADDTTVFHGHASARGGAAGGDGGLVEVSGKRQLVYRGVTDTRAPQGETGTLLLDPNRIEIANGAHATASNANLDTGGSPVVVDANSSASVVTVYEKDLEAQFSDIKLLAGQYIYLRDLDDETPSNSLDTDGVLDIGANKLTLKVENGASSGRIWFEDLNDTIRVSGGAKSVLIIDGGSSGSVSVDVGNLEAHASADSDAWAKIDVRTTGPVSIGDIEVTAVAEANDAAFTGSATADLGIYSDRDIVVDGDILVSAVAERASASSKRLDAEAGAYIKAGGGSGSAASVTVKGDVDVEASAQGNGSGVYDADADADLEILADGDITVKGNGDDEHAIEVTAFASASSTEAKGAEAAAFAYLHAGREFDSDSSDNGGIRVDGGILLDAEASLVADEASGSSAEAWADAQLYLRAPDDAGGVVDSNAPGYDGQSGILVDGDIDVHAKGRLRGADDFDSSDLVGFVGAFATVDVFAGSHSSGAFELNGNLSVSADAKALYTERRNNYFDTGFKGPFPSAVASAYVDIYAADRLDIESNIDVEARAISSAGNEPLGDVRNGGAIAYSTVYLQAGVPDRNWLYSAGSASTHAHNSNADIRVGGDIDIVATATYRGNGFGRASAWADGFIEAAEDITLEGDIRVSGESRSVGTGSVYRSDKVAHSVIDFSDSTFDLSYLGGDAIARAYLAVWAGMHSDGDLTVFGDVAVDASATMLNGSMGMKTESGSIDYLERAEAVALASASFFAADQIHVEGENGIEVSAKTLSVGELNGSAVAHADLYAQAGGTDPRGLDEHGSSNALIDIDGPVDVEARAGYKGNAGHVYQEKGLGDFYLETAEAEAKADAVFRSAGDILLGDDITVLADAGSLGRELAELPFENGSLDVYDPGDWTKLRLFYLGIGPADADASAEFHAEAGTDDGGSFTLDGTLSVSANANLDSSATEIRDWLDPDSGKFPFGDIYVDDYINPVADADATVSIFAAGDVTITGNASGSANSATKQAMDVDATARSTGRYARDAKADADIEIWAGLKDDGKTPDLKDDKADLAISGDVDVLASANYSGDHGGSAEALVNTELFAARDVSLTGDLDVQAKARSDGSTEPYANKGLGTEYDPRRRLADDADAKINLAVFAGLGSSGSITLNGDVDVHADAKLNDGSFAYTNRHDGIKVYDEDKDSSYFVKDSAEAEAQVDVYLYAADNILLDGDSISIRATALSSGEFNGDAVAENRVSIVTGDDDPLGKDYHGSNGSIHVKAEEVLVSADADYAGNAYGMADAFAGVYLQSAGDITLATDFRVLADASANGVQLDDPVDDSNNFIYEDDDYKYAKRGEYLGVGSADAEARFLVEAGSHSSGSFHMTGALDVQANAMVSSNFADLDSSVSMYAYLQKKLVGYDMEKGGKNRDADADVKIRVKAAQDVTFFDSDTAIHGKASAEAIGVYLGTAWASADIRVEAGKHVDASDDAGTGSLEITGDIILDAYSRYRGDMTKDAKSSVDADFEAAADIDIVGNVLMSADALAEGTGAFAPSEDYAGADKATAKTDVEFHAGKKLDGSFRLTGSLTVRADAEGVDAKNLHMAFARAEIAAANDIVLIGPGDAKLPDFRVTANGRTSGSSGRDLKADQWGNQLEFDLPTGSKSPFSSEAASATHVGQDVLAEFYLRAGADDLDGASSANLVVDGDVMVRADTFVDAKKIDRDTKFIGDKIAHDGGAISALTVLATRDIVIDGNIHVRALADQRVQDTGSSAKGGGEEALALFQAYAGQHSDGDYRQSGALIIDADAGNLSATSAAVLAGTSDEVALATAQGVIGAANDIVLDGDITVNAHVRGLEAAGGAKASAALDLLAALHGDGSSQSGDVEVGGKVDVDAIASADFGDAAASASLVVNAANSHDGFNDDVVIDGPVTVDASGRDGGGSSDVLGLFASIEIGAGDDIILGSGPPTARAADLAGFGSTIAICGPGPCENGTDTATAGSDSSENTYTAMVTLNAHEGFDDPLPEVPGDTPPVDEPGVVTTGGGTGAPGFIPQPPSPPLPPLPPEIQDVVLRTVTAWLEVTYADPELFTALPPGVLQDIAFDASGRVTFTDSFFEVYFPRAFASGICGLMSCPAELTDFLEAYANPPHRAGPGDDVAMVTRDDSS